MAARGCKFYLLVLKIERTRERYFQQSKINFVSPRVHVISSISPPTNNNASHDKLKPIRIGQAIMVSCNELCKTQVQMLKESRNSVRTRAAGVFPSY